MFRLARTHARTHARKTIASRAIVVCSMHIVRYEPLRSYVSFGGSTQQWRSNRVLVPTDPRRAACDKYLLFVLRCFTITYFRWFRYCACLVDEGALVGLPVSSAAMPQLLKRSVYSKHRHQTQHILSVPIVRGFPNWANPELSRLNIP